jgi:hypothetical protein
LNGCRAAHADRGGGIADRDDIARALRRRIAENQRLIDAHRETVAFVKLVERVAQRDVDASAEHPYLLMQRAVAAARVVRDARAEREIDFDELERRRPAGRRQIAPQIARRRIAPFRLLCALTSGCTGASSRSPPNSAASDTPKPAASLSRTTAVGLADALDDEIIERLTPERAASVSSV